MTPQLFLDAKPIWRQLTRVRYKAPARLGGGDQAEWEYLIRPEHDSTRQ